MKNISTILSDTKSLVMTRRGAVQLAATLPLLFCLLAAPLFTAAGSQKAANDHSGHASPDMDQPTVGMDSSTSPAPCERLVPMLLGLAIYYSLHKLIFWLNPWFKAASPLNSQFEVGQLVVSVVGLAIVFACWFLAHHQHVAAELSVAVAQVAVLGVLFVVLRRANRTNKQVLEVFGHELCSFSVLCWIIYLTAIQQGPGAVAPLVVGAAAVTHMNYVMYCWHAPQAANSNVEDQT